MLAAGHSRNVDANEIYFLAIPHLHEAMISSGTLCSSCRRSVMILAFTIIDKHRQS